MQILSWYKTNKRALPWRNDQEPYRVWLSEIILQQTRVNQGMAYFERFINSYPTIQALAKADEIDALKLWEGLGYYSRARNLHHTSRYIVENFDGVFPDTFLELQKLKGIGKYTAAAIASICFNEAVPAIDGNAYRVYARYYGVFDDISSSGAWRTFYKLGSEVMDKKYPGDFNQAIMDLGADVCKPKIPNCTICPLNNSCFALSEKKISELPVKTKKIKKIDRHLHYFYIENNEQVLIKKRTGNDIWKNLYELPCYESDKKEKAPEIIGKEEDNMQIIASTKHLLTHQNLYISFWKGSFSSLNNQFADHILVDKNKLLDFPFPKPILGFLTKMISIC